MPDAPIRTFRLPMSRDRRRAMTAYGEVFDAAVSAWSEGRRVVIGVEGDVSIYASVHYVMDMMVGRGIAVEQLPGIPSFIAAAGAERLSLVSQQEWLLVMPGLEDGAALTRAIDSGCVVVLMKLSGSGQAVKDYIAANPGNTYYYIENASSHASYHTADPGEITSRHFPYFSLMIVRRKDRVG